MPFHYAEDRKGSAIVNCDKCCATILEISNYVDCDECGKNYHLKCEGIFGQHIARVSNSVKYVCKECRSNVVSTVQDSETENTKRKTMESSPVNNQNSKRVNNQASPSLQFDNEQINKLFQFIQEVHNDLKSDITEIKTNQEFLSNKFDDFNLKINELSKEHKQFKKDLQLVQTQHNDQTQIINKLEADVDSFHQKELNNNMIIGGLPQKTDAKNAMNNIMNTLNTDCSITDISDLFFLHNKQTAVTATQKQTNQNTSLLLVKFKNYNAKLELIEKKKQKRSLFVNEIGLNSPSDAQIYFRDHVTPFKMNLFKECKDLKDQINFKHLWMNNSQILLRKTDQSKVFSIHSRNDLIKLKLLINNEKAQSLSQEESTLDK